jgi:hypothetical protein
MYGRLALLASMAPGLAYADDLGDTLAYLQQAGSADVRGLEALAEFDDNSALPMLISRDVKPGAPLDSYDCFGSAIDQTVLRTSGEEKLALRWCMELRWEKDQLAGYRTLGEIRLDPRDVADAIRMAARETNVPAQLIDLIIRYSSGYRPGVVSEDGHYGLMQLAPEHLREVGIDFENLLDPRENILVGARYLARLTHRFSDLMLHPPRTAKIRLGWDREGQQHRCPGPRPFRLCPVPSPCPCP